MVRFGSIRFRSVRAGSVRCDSVRFSSVWFELVRSIRFISDYFHVFSLLNVRPLTTPPPPLRAGTKIGFYFAWLKFYTAALVYPTLMGLLVWWTERLNRQAGDRPTGAPRKRTGLFTGHHLTRGSGKVVLTTSHGSAQTVSDRVRRPSNSHPSGRGRVR